MFQRRKQRGKSGKKKNRRTGSSSRFSSNYLLKGKQGQTRKKQRHFSKKVVIYLFVGDEGRRGRKSICWAIRAISVLASVSVCRQSISRLRHITKHIYDIYMIEAYHQTRGSTCPIISGVGECLKKSRCHSNTEIFYQFTISAIRFS